MEGGHLEVSYHEMKHWPCCEKKCIRKVTLQISGVKTVVAGLAEGVNLRHMVAAAVRNLFHCSCKI